MYCSSGITCCADEPALKLRFFVAARRARPAWLRSQRFLRQLVGLIIVSLGLLATAWAGNPESLAFKGVALGSPITPLAGDPRYDCKATRAPAADRICSLRSQEQETVAGQPVNSIFWFFYRGRLTSIVINLDERYFKQVVAALQKKYGAGETRTEQVKNLKGARFDNSIHTWRQVGGSLVAQRYAGRLDKSSLRYADDAAIRAIEAQRQSQQTAPEQDL
jgi:hypothetical protein